MRTPKSKAFGSYSRAQYGCIVTFLMPDGSTEVKHFSSVLHAIRRKLIRDRGYIEQVIDWADEHEAKVTCISTPETILRDLQGTREILEPQRKQKHAADIVSFPERSVLRGRTDLLELPRRR